MRTGMTLSLIPDGDTFISSSGSPTKKELKLVIEDGVEKLVVTGEYDIRTMINSYKDQTDLSYIMARLAAGDASVLAVGNPMYGDFSNMTYDHREVVQQVMDARTYFDHLSDDIKSKFDNDFGKWIASVGSRDWADKMTKKPVEPSLPVVEPSLPVVESGKTVVEPAKPVVEKGE